MFRTDSILGFVFWNSLFALGLFWVFHLWGWIALGEVATWQLLLAVAVVSIVSHFVGGILKMGLLPIYAILAIFTLGFGIFVINGTITVAALMLYAVNSGYFAFTAGFWSWQTFVMVLGFGMIRLRLESND